MNSTETVSSLAEGTYLCSSVATHMTDCPSYDVLSHVLLNLLINPYHRVIRLHFTDQETGLESI